MRCFSTSFEVEARLLANATNFSWWSTGSTQSITPVQPGKATINVGPSFTGGQVCVGISYSAAPWYRQICRTVSVCPGARIASGEAEHTVWAGVVYPNPSQESFMFTADGDIRQLSVTDPLGRGQQQLGALGSGKQIRFGSQLPAGSYWLRIQYENKTHRAIKLLKAGR